MNIKYILYISITVFILFIERLVIFFEVFSPALLLTRFLEIQLFLLYITIVFKAKRNFGLFNLFTLFILTFGLFNLMKIFFGLFSNENYKQVFSTVPIDLSELVVQEVLWVYTLTLTILYLSFRSFYSFKEYHKDFIKTDRGTKWLYYKDKKLFRYGYLTMLATLIFVLYRCYIEVNYFVGVSFTELYIGGAAEIPIPSYVRVLSIFFQVGFMMVLGSKPSKRQFILFSFIYIFSISPNLLIGLRNQFALSVLFLVWYYVKVYEIKVNLLKIFIPAVFIIILLQVIAYNRSGETLNENLLLLIPLFLTAQSTSMYVLSLYIQNKEIIMAHNYYYVLDPIIGWLTGADGQSLEVLAKRSSLGHQMIYTLSPDTYLAGQSLGTSFVAELYEFGWIGLIIGSVFFAWVILKFELGVKANRNYLLTSLFFCSYLLIAPRSTFFPNIYFLIRYCIIYFVILFFGLLCEKAFKKDKTF